MPVRNASILALALFVTAGAAPVWAQPEGGAAAPAAQPAEAKPAGTRDPAAEAMLNESIAAIKALKSLRFHVKRDTNGMGDAMRLSAEGEMLWVRPAAGKVNTFSFRGTTDIVGEGVKPQRLSIFAPQRVVWIDEETKTVWDQPFNQQAKGFAWVSRLQGLALPEFLMEPEPMARLARARSLTIEGVKDIRGEACTVIHAVIEEGKSEARVAISNVDKLPRLLERKRIEKNMTVGPSWELWDVSLKELTLADLELPVPEGYKVEKTEAPAAPTTPPAGANNAPATKGAGMVPAGGLPIGTAIPALAGQFADGSKFDAAALNGKVTVLGFWQSQVAGSGDLVGSMQKFKDSPVGKNAQVFGVACREGADAAGAKSFLDAHGVNFPTVVSGDPVANSFNVRGFPSVVVINAEGKVAAFLEGNTSYEALTAAVEGALKK